MARLGDWLALHTRAYGRQSEVCTKWRAKNIQQTLSIDLRHTTARFHHSQPDVRIALIQIANRRDHGRIIQHIVAQELRDPLIQLMIIPRHGRDIRRPTKENPRQGRAGSWRGHEVRILEGRHSYMDQVPAPRSRPHQESRHVAFAPDYYAQSPGSSRTM